MSLSILTVAAAAAALVSSGGAAPRAAATPSCAPIDRSEVAGLFDAWNLALASLDADAVTQRYWSNAVLLPTVSNTPRTDAAMIRDYFEHFLQKRPRGRIDTRTIEVGCNLAIDAGTYTFSLMGDDGRISEVAARYSFVYAFRDGAWKILHHHSSAMPETAPAAAAPAHAQVAPATNSATPRKAPPDAARPHKSSASSSERSRPSPARAPHGAATSSSFLKPPDEPDARSASSEADTAADEAADDAAPGAPRPFLHAAISPRLADYLGAATRSAERAGSTTAPSGSGAARVLLRVCVGPQGELSKAPKILRSSGEERIDAAVRNWARDSSWIPATVDRRAVEGCTRLTARVGS